MKKRLLQYLACPDCRGDLTLDHSEREDRDGEVLEGSIRCEQCHRLFPVHRGVPRLIPAGVERLSVEVAASFGWEWNEFDELRPHYHEQFLDWVQPLRPDDFADKVVIEGGCGKGRHSSLVAGYGAREVFAVDLGSAVEAAFQNTRHLRAVHVIQGDITQLPLKPCADLAFSVGVLHHLPDPEQGFRALSAAVRAGGYEAARPIGWALAGAAKGVYRPLSQGPGRAVHSKLFYADYLTYIARFPVREIHSIVFDHLVTPVAHYLSRGDLAAWFDDERFRDVRIAPHNANSWRGTATVSGRPTTGASSGAARQREDG
jgi:uncharacterized protein YbaR (Trm112 family)/2-polyprenyl-3-methyl-5-hydroxy-6-metoxy-1,4-benzoquinol methylase